jgi:hypothetical protein
MAAPASTPPPAAAQRKRITVRATQACTTVDCDTKRHYLRDRDQVFDVWSDAFCEAHMVKAEAGEAPPALPPLPPETTLPARNQPVPIAR